MMDDKFQLAASETQDKACAGIPGIDGGKGGVREPENGGDTTSETHPCVVLIHGPIAEGPGDSDSKAASDLQRTPATNYLSLFIYNFCQARSNKHSNLSASMSAAAGLSLREGEKMR